MKKVNINEKAEAINTFRLENLSKTFTGSELQEALLGLGFNKTVASRIMTSCIPFEKIGLSRLYSFTKEPIHCKQIEAAYKHAGDYRRRNKSPKPKSEKQPTTAVVEDGLFLCKRVFDEKRFAKENPLIYSQYCKYVPVTR